ARRPSGGSPWSIRTSGSSAATIATGGSTGRSETTMERRRIYSFGGGEAEGSASMVALLGGKGAGLQEMTRLGIPVPPGFTITTETCEEWTRAGKRLPEALLPELEAALDRLERSSGKTFGQG